MSRVQESLVAGGSMAEGTGSFQNQDRLTIFTRNWLADNPKAVIFISHGITEHSGRFRKLATFLQENQYSVYAHDHVGHGKSGGDRVHINDYQTYVRDVIQHLEVIKSKHPDLSLFIIGESMGGLITALTVVERPQLITGIVLSAPAMLDDRATSFQVGLLRILSWCVPQYGVLPDNPGVLSTLQEEIQERQNDPLVYHHGIKAKWTLATINAQRLIQRRVQEIQIPFLTLHGTEDTTVNIASSQFLMEHSRSEDKTMKVSFFV
ncbi:monoglyceride lipase-like [Dysidea avara]|uniref:monoglyceride lipase-like n=1 Tax=Dysidea avara TaxID=196820 RepID=UPI003328A35F